MLHVPPVSKVIVPFATLHTPGVWLVSVTASPELAMAITAKGLLPKVWLAIEAKLMVCGVTPAASRVKGENEVVMPQT
jgi:hypothetical protein